MSKTVIKTYKFRLYPTKAQVKTFEHTLDLCRELYNAALQERRAAWKLNRIRISCFDQIKQLPEIRENRSDLKSVNSQVLEAVLQKADLTFQQFFSRIKRGVKAGYPRFKGKNSFNSFTFRQKGFGFENSKLKLSKIGKIKIKLHREIIGKIKICTISRNPTGKWFVCFSCEVSTDALEPVNKSVGLDVGLAQYATLSTGEQIANPKFFKTDEKELAKIQRKVSKSIKGSKIRRRHWKAVFRVNERIGNRRNNFAHQLSRKLVNNYDRIFFEDLNIKGMVQNRNLSKSIGDAAWSQTIEFTRYKAENAGRLFALVNPRNTSLNCSKCGEKTAKTLSVRVHDCKNCGLKIDRDLNAAINILALGLQGIGIESVEAVINTE